MKELLTTDVRGSALCSHITPFFSGSGKVSLFVHFFSPDHCLSLKIFFRLESCRSRGPHPRRCPTFCINGRQLTRLSDLKRFLMATSAVRAGFHAPVDSDAAACDVPSITIMRPHSPFSSSSQYSTWDQHGQFSPAYDASAPSSSSSSSSPSTHPSLTLDSPMDDTESPPECVFCH